MHLILTVTESMMTRSALFINQKCLNERDFWLQIFGSECLTQKRSEWCQYSHYTHLLFLYLACSLFNWKTAASAAATIGAHCNVLIVSICQPKITKDSIKSWIHRQKFATTKENATWPPSSLLKQSLPVRYEQLQS